MIDQKEAKKKFKQYTAPMGLFQIRNLTNGKIFIVGAANLPGQMNSLRFQLKNNLHMNRILQEDFSRLGEERFVFEELDRLEPKSDPGYDPAPDLQELEEMWLEKLQPYDEKGYNKRKPPAKK